MAHEYDTVCLLHEGLAQAVSQPFGIIRILASTDLRDDLIKKGLRLAC